MRTKTLYTILVIPIILILTACSGNASAQTSSQNVNTQNQQQNPAADFANQPVENKLAIGILHLEGTDKAVTADQAKTMLPLWQAVKSLRTNSNTTTEEMNGLYKQIEASLTADQVRAIKDLTLNQQDMQALMDKYGIKFQPNPSGTLDPNALATRTAARSNGTGGGGPSGNFSGGVPGGGTGRQNNNGGQPNIQRTPQAGQTRTGGGFRGGLNSLFVEPLIELLQQRSAS